MLYFLTEAKPYTSRYTRRGFQLRDAVQKFCGCNSGVLGVRFWELKL